MNWPMSLSLKKEVLRKLFHLMEIPVVVIYSVLRYYWSERVAILVLTAGFLLLLEIESIRLEVKLKLPKNLNLLRPREHNNVSATSYFIAATIISFGAFDYTIALLALLLTVFGDLVSAIVGVKYGKHRIFRKKTLEGFFAGFMANLLVGFLILPQSPLIYMAMAFVASVVELVTNKLDDNLTVPVFAGFTGQIMAYIVGAQLAGFPGTLDWMFQILPR